MAGVGFKVRALKGLTWERGFFDEAMAAVLFDREKWAEAPVEVQGLLRLSGVRRGNVLDAACGVGRHSLALAGKGFDVTGIDFNPTYLKQARQKAKRQGLKVRFEQAQLADLRAYAGTFDLVTNLFTSFGYYSAARQNENALRQMVACLKPGGRLAIELLPRETLTGIFHPQAWQTVPGGHLLQERRYLSGGTRLGTRAIWAVRGRHRVQDSIIHLYTRAELAELFRRAGLIQVKAYGDFDGRRFKAGDRLLMIGRKP